MRIFGTIVFKTLSYIDANDFESPKALSEYLIYLSKNSTAYNAYFEWKQHVVKPKYNIWFAPLCDMCVKLHLEEYFGTKVKKNIHDIDTYWNDGSCKELNKL